MSEMLTVTVFYIIIIYTSVHGFSGSLQNEFEYLNDSETLDCPPWFLSRAVASMDNGLASHICSCTDKRQEIIRCDEFNQKSFLSLNYCVTTDNKTILAGPCPYHFASNHTIYRLVVTPT